MSGLADVRLPGVDVLFRPGTSMVVELVWPEGALDGRSFTSTLNGQELNVALVGDTLVVEAGPDVTGALTAGVPASWLLLEDLGGDAPEPILQGVWTPSNAPRAGLPTTVQVTQGAATVAVTVTPGGAGVVALAGRVETVEDDVAGLAGDVEDLTGTVSGLSTQLDGKADTADLTAHEAARVVSAEPVHGVLEHRWSKSGWAPFTARVVNQDGSQSFETSVEDGYGRVTGTTTGGNHRVMYTHAGMVAEDGEIMAVLRGPSIYVSTPSVNRPQLGLLLRYQEIDGHHVGYVAWYDAFAGNPRIVNMSAWRGNGSATLNQAAGGQYSAEVARDLRVLGVRRFEFLGLYISEYACEPHHLHGLASGDTVTVDLTSDDTFDAAAATVSNPDREKGTFQLASSAEEVVAYKAADGKVEIDDQARRFFPYAIKARLVGTELSVKTWRGRYEAEPADWQARVTVATDADFPELPDGPGLWGVVVGHAHSGSYGEFGDITFRSYD